MPLPRLDELIFKGTHNSYDDTRRLPPDVQVDQFGVWAVELDYSVLAGTTDLVVGHDGPGRSADGSGVFRVGGDYVLRSYLDALAETEALQFRPLFLYLEKKPWLWSLDNRYYENHPDELLSLVEEQLKGAFPGRLLGPKRMFDEYHDQLPSVRDSAGLVLPIAIAPSAGNDTIFPPWAPFGAAVQTEGCGRPDGTVPSPPIDSPLSPRVWRPNNFVSDWTFKYGVPPNPIVVAGTAPLTNEVEERCVGSVTDAFSSEAVTAQGTRRLPYTSVRAAIQRAAATIEIGNNGIYHRQVVSGAGFTLLIAPGRYERPLQPIDFPLTLRRDGSSGTVIIR